MLPEDAGISVPDHGNDSAAAAIIFRWAALCLVACFESASGQSQREGMFADMARGACYQREIGAVFGCRSPIIQGISIGFSRSF